MNHKKLGVMLLALGLAVGMSVMAEEKTPEAHDMMQKADANGDGKITFEEFKVAHEKHMQEHFKRIDTNGDGVIDEAEKKTMHEKMHKMREKMMERREMMHGDDAKSK